MIVSHIQDFCSIFLIFIFILIFISPSPIFKYPSKALYHLSIKSRRPLLIIMSSYSSQTSAEQVAQDCQNAITNKTVLVTGVSPGGLGAEFAKVIAIHGPSLLILASRDIAKAQQTAQEIADIAPGVPTRLLELDLRSQAQVRIAAKEVLTYKEDIDVLVNNAGVMASPFSLTDDGIESQFATNHVGHFLFTNLIMEKLVIPGKSCRIVNVSSNGHLLSPVRFHDWNFDVSIYVMVPNSGSRS
ncbi:hypothetical protein ABZX51_000197 [Aspergillus tubingensis]